jgi:PAS domain S-box-containing protein
VPTKRRSSFPKLGNGGKWCWFTAAPIKAADGTVVGAIETMWDNTDKKRAESDRLQYTRKLEENQRALSQIIQGSSIPTFVLNRDHTITHWNQALEKLTGHPSSEMVGTNRQWAPFWDSERPAMADVILDQKSDQEIWDLYGGNWKKSVLIDGGYEAEVFFPRLGAGGKWCWFTAAPIKAADGTRGGGDRNPFGHNCGQTGRRGAASAQPGTDHLVFHLHGPQRAADAAGAHRRCGVGNPRFHEGAKRLPVHVRRRAGGSTCGISTLAMQIRDTARPDRRRKAEIMRNVSRIPTSRMYLQRRRSPKPLFRLIRQADGCLHLPIFPSVPKIRKGLGVMRIERSTERFSSEELHLLDLMGNRIGATLENSLLHEEVIRKSNFQAKLIKSANDGIIATNDKWQTVIFNPAAEQIFGYSADDVVGTKDARDYLPQWVQETLNANRHGWRMPDETHPWIETEIKARNDELIPVRFSGTVLRENTENDGNGGFFSGPA